MSHSADATYELCTDPCDRLLKPHSADATYACEVLFVFAGDVLFVFAGMILDGEVTKLHAEMSSFMAAKLDNSSYGFIDKLFSKIILPGSVIPAARV